MKHLIKKILREETEWVDLLKFNNNKQININEFELDDIRFYGAKKSMNKIFGNGKSANNILKILLKKL